MSRKPAEYYLEKSRRSIELLERSNKVLKMENRLLQDEKRKMESTIETLLSYAKEHTK